MGFNNNQLSIFFRFNRCKVFIKSVRVINLTIHGRVIHHVKMIRLIKAYFLISYNNQLPKTHGESNSSGTFEIQSE
jgi:hypothetical protein